MIGDGSSNLVTLDAYQLACGGQMQSVRVDTKRTVMIKNAICGLVTTSPKAGKIFLTDVCDGPFMFEGGQVWARQLNPEADAEKVVARSKVQYSK